MKYLEIEIEIKDLKEFEIEDLKECASDVFHCQVRIGSPLNITGLTDYVSRPQYSTVVGLLQYNQSNSDDDLISGSDDSESGVWQPIWQGIKKIVNKVRSEF